jgi:hypothetical protein
MRRATIFLMLLGALATLPSMARSADATSDGTVWAGVFLGSEAPSTHGAEPANEESRSVVARMKKLPAVTFPHYRLLGEHVQPLLKEYESWLVPSRGFFFKLDSRGPETGGGVRVAVQLWHDKEVLVKTDVILRGDRPVIVRGPAMGDDGTLVIALRLVKE